MRAMPKHGPSPLLAINQGTTGTFPLGSATGSARLGSAPTAALNEGKSRAQHWEVWRKPGGVGSTQEEEEQGVCSAPGQELAEDKSGSSPFCPALKGRV